MNHYTQHADVKDIERTMSNRRATPVLDVILAVAIGLSLAYLLVKGLAQ